MIARQSFLIVSSQFFIRFIGWIGLVILAKLWGSYAPEALGIIGFAMAFLALFGFIGDTGFSQAHVKRISEGQDLGTCMGTFIAIKIAIISFMVLIIFTSFFISENILHISISDATTDPVIFVFILYYIFSNLYVIPVSTFQAKKEIVKRQLSLIIENVVKIPLVIIVALAGVSTLGALSISPIISWPSFLIPVQQFFARHAVGSLAITYVCGAASVFVIGMWFLRSYPIKKPNWNLCKSYFYFALPITFLSIITVISTNIDKIMIGYFWTSIEVGYYFTVQQVLQIVLIFSSAIGIVLFPTLSEYHAKKNFEKIKQTTHTAERYISMITIPPIVMIIVFANPIISIMLSDAFLPASSVLVTLSILAFVSGFGMPYSSLISGINKPGVAAKIGFIMCFTNIIFNYLFIPKDGLLSFININGPLGAAIATVLSSLIGIIGLRFAAKKLINIKLLQTHTPRHIIAGLVMAGVLYYLNIFIVVDRWYHLIGFACIGMLIYLIVLYLMKEFGKQDFLFFIDILQPKKMMKYISSEMNHKK